MPKRAVKVLNGERELNDEEREIFERNIGLIRLNAEAELPYSMQELACNKSFEGFRVWGFLRGIGVV